MFIVLVAPLGIVALGWPGMDAVLASVARILGYCRFQSGPRNGILSFLLFAGAMHIKPDDITSKKWVIWSFFKALVQEKQQTGSEAHNKKELGHGINHQ